MPTDTPLMRQPFADDAMASLGIGDRAEGITSTASADRRQSAGTQDLELLLLDAQVDLKIEIVERIGHKTRYHCRPRHCHQREYCPFEAHGLVIVFEILGHCQAF